MQGDIIGILNAAGTELVNYSYDAWGNILWTEDESGINLSSLNPYRYRGYYYDTETGLYYLNSRYYDPRTGRFINADEIEYLGADAEFSCNLYAYCANNPVMGVDVSGTSWQNIKEWFRNARVWCEENMSNGDGSYSLYNDARKLSRKNIPFKTKLFTFEFSKQGLCFDWKNLSIGIGSVSMDIASGGWQWENFKLDFLY